MIYLDTSALVKLVFDEDESPVLARWVEDRAEVPKISSQLSIIELLRVCRRLDEAASDAATLLLRGLDLLPVDRAVIDQAATVDPQELRSLDAIHLATALTVRESLTALVAYDDRLCSAGRRAGLPVESPS